VKIRAIRRSGRGRRETPGPPVKLQRAQTRCSAHAMQIAEANREHARCGCTPFVRVADVGRTHHASSSARGCKTSRRIEGAKPEGSSKHRKTRGTSGETAKRCAEMYLPKSWRIFWSAGFGLQIRRHDRRHSRTFAHAAFTGNVKQSPKACRSIAVTSSARNMSRVAHRAVRRPTRACLQVTTECQRLDTIR